MVAVRLQLSGLVSRWDDDGVGEDQQIQAVVISASTPEAMRREIANVLDQLAATVWGNSEETHSSA